MMSLVFKLNLTLTKLLNIIVTSNTFLENYCFTKNLFSQ
jgi:hypothetical protein